MLFLFLIFAGAVHSADVSRAILVLPKTRENAGVLSFEIKSGRHRGRHRCEALGRGATSLVAKKGWTTGTIVEADGRKTTIYYAPEHMQAGATIPGTYEMRNIRPTDYEIEILSQDLTGEEALVQRLTAGPSSKSFYSGVYKHWYPRDPRYNAVVPIDMIWSRQMNSSAIPILKREGIRENPKQLARNPQYYEGPYGRYGMAIHTDRWDDPETINDPASATRNERRSFLFRDTEGCVKVRPDCLERLNAYVDEQSSLGHTAWLNVREATTP